MLSVFGTYVVTPFSKYFSSSDWVELKDCVIVEPTEYEGPRRRPNQAFLPYVFFRYEWEGETYYSRQVGFAPGRAWNNKTRSQFEWDNKPGTVRSCWVNPDNPSEAVLIREISLRYFSPNGLVGFFFMGATGVITLWLWFGWLIKLILKTRGPKIGYYRGQ